MNSAQDTADPMIDALRDYQAQVIAGTPRRTSGLSDREINAFLAGYRYGKAQALSAKLMRDVLALCHPDRHPGREGRAMAAVKALLSLRDTGSAD